MIVRNLGGKASRACSMQRRGILKNLGANKKIIEEEKDSFHHEYSIRPDTYAFKVNHETKTSALVGKNNHEDLLIDKSHPLQEGRQDESMNLIHYIYKYSTNYPFGARSPQEIFDLYPYTNSNKLSRMQHRPKRVKMSTSDFIEDSLYNPNYGYFSKEVEIFHPEKPFNYNEITDVDEFMEEWKKSYKGYDEVEAGSMMKSTQSEVPVSTSKSAHSKFAQHAIKIHADELAHSKQGQNSKRSLQLWHTPTELFQPYYGESIARYLVVNYKLNGCYPYEDLIIYEMGGGNGTLMCDVLRYIKENEPEIYRKTQYKIIEITSQLAVKQVQSMLNSKLEERGLDKSKVQIVNKSIFDWSEVIEHPCYFLAFEVFDNFAHDLIRYDNATGIPYEGKVLIDEHGDFYEFFSPDLSYYANMYLNMRENGKHSVLKRSQSLTGKVESFKSLIPPIFDQDRIHPLLQSPTKLKCKNVLSPFKDGLTPGEFVPTRLLKFFHVLKHKFPRHSLISSDFNYLPNTIKGAYGSPVVQTVLQDRMVDVTTYMCHQGYFDIMFPTDFNVASDLYRQMTGKIPTVATHKDFLEQWADIEITTTKTGENPMLEFYKNVSFMIS